MGALSLSTADLRVFAEEPLVQDVALGKRLGMAQALDIRRVIKKREEELLRYGSFRAVREMIATGKGAHRAVTVYYLNEAQALLICMFSQTATAADVREELIKVFMAYRRGALVQADMRQMPANDRIDGHHAMARSSSAFQGFVDEPEFAKRLPQIPVGWYTGKNRINPRCWSDLAVREAVIVRHRQMTLDAALAEMRAEFGDERPPSKSALQRIWQRLDKIREAA